MADEPARPVILITGASAGIGTALARELARRRPEATIVLTARRLERLDRLADELRASHPGLSVATIPRPASSILVKARSRRRRPARQAPRRNVSTKPALRAWPVRPARAKYSSVYN